ncbi:2-hydroxyacid dehydrogenase [Indiicoccus explosivorum]|uniref:2-hydroxyacid dehydrogenase n=1 Tax=Indiicoccus explosivorum TaxID=1917864 RepID=UPI000B44DCF0|nr:D-glycerate dehydrogenase [Indiicoccus explosivorum]
MKPIVYVTRKLPDEAIAALGDQVEVRMWKEEETPVPRDILLKEAAEATAIWSMLSDAIDRELIEKAPNLKIISNLAVGYNNIDLDAARDNGVIVTNTPDALTEATADLTFALLLSTARRLSEASRALRAGEWKAWTPLGFTGQDVYGATIGIIGMGRIGEAVARRAKGFGMRVLYHNRTRRRFEDFIYSDFDELLKESDFVVLLTPYTSETAGMIGERELGLMKETACLINVARGGIVDEKALEKALKDGGIWAAGLDVFEQEPVPTDHPLLSLPNVTVTPHIGSASIQARHAMMQLNAEAILACIGKKEVQNRVC